MNSMNPLTQLAPSATTMIQADHSFVLSLFRKLKPTTSPSVRQATTRHICTALEVHAQLEEEIFYPALRATGVQLAALERSVPEHDEMRQLVGRVRSAEGQGAQPALLEELMRVVLHHVADEETLVLAAAEQRLGDQLSALGAQMTERRLQLLKPRAAELAADVARGAPAKTALVAIGTLTAGALLFSRLRRLGASWQYR